jgi:hypothetical protein
MSAHASKRIRFVPKCHHYSDTLLVVYGAWAIVKSVPV